MRLPLLRSLLCRLLSSLEARGVRLCGPVRFLQLTVVQPGGGETRAQLVFGEFGPGDAAGGVTRAADGGRALGLGWLLLLLLGG